MKVLFALLMALTAAVSWASAKSAIQERTVVIDLPRFRVSFTLPREVEIPPWKSPDAIFDSTNPSFERDGFREVTVAHADFNGPFWVGTRGSLKVSFLVVKPSPQYHGAVLSTTDLEGYVRWWIDGSTSRDKFQFDRASLNGAMWVHRWYDTFDRPSPPERERNDIYSIPLDETMFLDVGVLITEWIPGTSKMWKGKAEALCRSIKESIVVEKKANQALVPTVMSVTPAADAPVAPVTTAAHL